MRRLWSLIAALLCSCAPGPLPPRSTHHTLAREELTRGQLFCSGVRTGPELIMTAEHCGAPLYTKAGRLSRIYALDRDVAAFYDPNTTAEHYVGAVQYLDEPLVKLDLQRGITWAHAQLSSLDLLEIDTYCYPGDSGSPVYSDRGVVAIVVARTVGYPKCWAALALSP